MVGDSESGCARLSVHHGLTHIPADRLLLLVIARFDDGISITRGHIHPSISQGPPASQQPLHLWFPSSTTLPHTIITIAVASGVLILIVCRSPRSHHHDSHQPPHQRLNLRTFIWHTTRTNLLFSSQTTPKASIIVRRPLIRHSEAIKGADIWTRQHTRGERDM